jgi:hypothetical protein
MKNGVDRIGAKGSGKLSRACDSGLGIATFISKLLDDHLGSQRMTTIDEHE